MAEPADLTKDVDAQEQLDRLLDPPPAAGVTEAAGARKRDPDIHCRSVRMVPIEAVMEGPDARKNPDEDVDELARDIRKQGLLHPLLIRTDMSIVAGRRRLAALKLLKQTHVPVVTLPEESDTALVEIAENLCRRDLTVQEKARLYTRWLKATGGKQADLARALGVKAPRISEVLATLEPPTQNEPQKAAPATTQEAVAQGRASRQAKREEKAADAAPEKTSETVRKPGKPAEKKESLLKVVLPDGVKSAVVGTETVSLALTLDYSGALTRAKLVDAFDEVLKGALIRALRDALATLKQ